MPPTIPVNDLRRQSVDELEQLKEIASRVVGSGWHILGPEVERFEDLFARYLGVRHVIGVANGTDALELSLRAIGVGPGSEVIVAANAAGYANVAARLAGAQITYVDVLPHNGLIDPDSLAATISDRTAAVVVTHLFGQMVDIDDVRTRIPDRVRIIEDCAQAHGATHRGRRAGSRGDIAAFSFYPTKNLGAIGDGGAVATSDLDLHRQVRSLRTYGWGKKYEVELAHGRNSRLDELQAAFLSYRLDFLDQRNDRRRAIAAEYARGVAAPLFGSVDDERYVAHLCVFAVDQRSALRTELAACGVATDVHYPVPDHRQAAWYAADVTLPVTEMLAEHVVTVPCFPEMTDDEVAHVASTLSRFLK